MDTVLLPESPTARNDSTEAASTASGVGAPSNSASNRPWIAEAAAPDPLIPFPGEHAETVIDAIHAAGGDVLKLIGNGTLVIFSASDPAEACRAL